MSTVAQLLVPLAGAVAAYLAIRIAKAVYEEFTSPLRSLPGPSGGNLLFGHFFKVEKDLGTTLVWRREFGSTFQFRGFFNKRELYTTDTKALNHILTHDRVYQKGPAARKLIMHFMGNSVLAAETDEHRRMRRILNPAFGVAQIRLLTEIFNEKSMQLRDMWLRQTADSSSATLLDVYAGLRKATLDVIGQAGFHYDFNALDPADNKVNELDEAITHLFHSEAAQRNAGLRFIQMSLPLLSLLPDPGGRVQREARETLLRVSKKLFHDSKMAVKAAGGIPSSTSSERDLLSILVKANTAEDIPEHQRLSDADVIAQVPTVAIAGHETSSTGTAWALHALALHPDVQSKLRTELLSLPSDHPTMDQLNALPYLENFIREVMRLYTPVSFTLRVAMEEDIIPLARGYVDKQGKDCDSIRIPKGTAIRIPISDIHLEMEIWGDDALEFRPERWENIPDAASAVPGVWANLLTFLAGSHNCIGFRFSLVEMKAFLFTLVRAFKFAPDVAAGEITCSTTPVRRPRVKREPEKGSQLPLLVGPHRAV